MRIEFVAFESMGVRSQATYIETPDARIFIDPAAALAPRRFSLPPHVREVERLRELYREIERRVEKSDVVIVTHYHYDHHDPARFLSPELYRGKTIILKDYRNKINVSQRIRAYRFLKILERVGCRIEVADGRDFSFGETRIAFSQPVEHGPDSRLGFVVPVCISDGREALLYTSDVEGPVNENVVIFAGMCRPRVLVLDGPSTYLIGYKYPEEAFVRSIELMKNLLRIDSVEVMVVDHHLLRDLSYSEKLREVFEVGRRLGKRVLTAAEFMGLKPTLLEARRRELFAEEPVDGLEMLRSMRIDLRMLGE